MVVKAPARKPGAAELKRRAKRIKLVLTDNDGVLTDTGVYYGPQGEALKRFSIRDGMGVELLRNAGIETAIITSEVSESVLKRSEKLRMKHVFIGIKNKHGHLDTILAETGLKADELAYIGDDVNDLEIIRTINTTGLTGAPQDAMPVIGNIVHYRCRQRGGNGAFRDFAGWILKLRGASNTLP
jgi:3-deoxy-D-manno-octulosonate 8-phosphate phosphatase (KDO 8-P phosphatase)